MSFTGTLPNLRGGTLKILYGSTKQSARYCTVVVAVTTHLQVGWEKVESSPAEKDLDVMKNSTRVSSQPRKSMKY